MARRKGSRGARNARSLRKYLLEKYGPVCQICVAWKRTGKITLIDLSVENGPLSYSVDHIIAVADGGTDLRENKQPAHRICNSVKGSSTDNQRHRMPKMPRINEGRSTREPRRTLRYSSSSPGYQVKPKLLVDSTY